MKPIAVLICLTVLVAMWVGSRLSSHGGDRHCARCGCQERLTKVCRLVRGEKTISTTFWGVQEETFCVNGPSCPGCSHCETVCTKKLDGNEDSKVCAETKLLKWTNWIPGGSPTIMTKKKLMKKTVTKLVPSFRWVVEDLCTACKDGTNRTGADWGGQVSNGSRILRHRISFIQSGRRIADNVSMTLYGLARRSQGFAD